MNARADLPVIGFSLNGKTCHANVGDTILDAARRSGVRVPALCHSERQGSPGNCRACVVEVAGERVLAPSCCRAVEPGMVVVTDSERALKSQRMVVEMLLADLPEIGDHGELAHWATVLGVVARPQLTALRRDSVAVDLSHPAMKVDLNACIQCTRCVRACRDVQVNDVIGMNSRGADTQVIFDLADPMGASTCVGCGECVQACPTGALTSATGALTSATGALTSVGAPSTEALNSRDIDSVCPYCGVGCQLTYKVEAEKIVEVIGRDGPANLGRLCVKGRYGFDHIHHPERLTRPLIRIPGVPKAVPLDSRTADWRSTFREASWDEALDFAAHELKRLRDQNGGPSHGFKSLAGFGSAKGSNEEAYLFQKLVRTAFGSHNVDHCTRLCHASSVAALLEGVGSGAVSNPVMDVLQAEVIFVIGANPASNHPVAASFIKNAVKRGAKLILADPRRTDLARHAWRVMQFKPDTDVVLLNAMIHVVLADQDAALGPKSQLATPASQLATPPSQLATPSSQPATPSSQRRLGSSRSDPATPSQALDASLRWHDGSGGVKSESFETNQPLVTGFIRSNATDLVALRNTVQAYSPEAVADQCGVDAATIRECALAFAAAKGAMILWGMGISQHVHGTDNARALIALSTVAGQIGKPGSGLHPLRGQNNVQGASDAGLIPMMLPNYQRVTEANTRAWFEDFWKTPLATEPGLTVVEILNKALAADADPQKIRGLYIMGENPAMSDPDLHHARHALASLAHLVVQDIFMTETAWLADVVLPASAWPEKVGTVTNTDRIVQLGRRAVNPPGDARPDLWIIQELGKRLGQSWHYPVAPVSGIQGHDDGAAAVFAELRQSMQGARDENPFQGITWARLQREGAVTYPCASESEPGESVIFKDRFPTPTGLAKLVPVSFKPAAELPDDDYPFVLITGRVLEHWHTGSMSRRSSALDAIEPQATVSINPLDAQALKLHAGDFTQVESRRGQVSAQVKIDPGTPAGSVFMAFAFAEAAANLLTHAALDPVGKIPEFKFCAVKLV